MFSDIELIRLARQTIEDLTNVIQVKKGRHIYRMEAMTTMAEPILKMLDSRIAQSTQNGVKREVFNEFPFLVAEAADNEACMLALEILGVAGKIRSCTSSGIEPSSADMASLFSTCDKLRQLISAGVPLLGNKVTAERLSKVARKADGEQLIKNVSENEIV